MDIVEHLIERARSRPRTVVLPEGGDPRILQAARRLHDGGIARPMLIGERAALEAAAAAAGVSIDTERRGGRRRVRERAHAERTAYPLTRSCTVLPDPEPRR